MITFVHTADLHFGVENYGRVDSKTGIHTRLLDFNASFSFVVSQAIETQVDFFLMCGDAYKTAHPTPTQQRLLLDNLFRLFKAGIPVVLVVGNHDIPGSFGKSHALDLFSRLPIEGFHVIAKPKLLRLQTKSGPVQIIGIPWPTRNTISLNKTLNTSSTNITKQISTAVSSAIEQLAQQACPKTPTILAGHLTASTGRFSGAEKCATTGQDPLFLPSQLAQPGIDYIALGHLHRYQQVNPTETPPIVYSGSIERIDFGETRDTKGFCIVKIPKKGSVDISFVPTPVRPFIQISLTLQTGSNPTEQIVNEIKKHDLTDAIIKIIYTVPTEITEPINLKAINTACNNAHYIASIIPIIQAKPRTTRAKISTQIDTPEALKIFLQTQDLSEAKIERIQQKLAYLMSDADPNEDSLHEFEINLQKTYSPKTETLSES